MNAVDLREYDRVLNDYHTDLLDAAFLTSHLLDLCLDTSDLPEWRVAACHMMRNRLVELAEALPFPSMFREGDAPVRSEVRMDAPSSGSGSS